MQTCVAWYFSNCHFISFFVRAIRCCALFFQSVFSHSVYDTDYRERVPLSLFWWILPSPGMHEMNMYKRKVKCSLLWRSNARIQHHPRFGIKRSQQNGLSMLTTFADILRIVTFAHKHILCIFYIHKQCYKRFLSDFITTSRLVWN